MANNGNLLSAYLDFTSGTGNAELTAPDRPIQLVTRHTFLWKRLWKNNGQPVDGGAQLQWHIITKGNGTFEEVLPGTSTQPVNPQVLQKAVCDWRFTRAHTTTNKQEILLNDRIRSGTRMAQFQQFVNIRDEKATIRAIEVATGMEGQLSAVPNKAKMEGASSLGATSPYSIFSIINQNANGLWGTSFTASAAVTAAGGAWTHKCALDPTSAAINGTMNPQFGKYSLAGPSNGAALNIVSALDSLYMDMSWEQPDTLAKYQSDEQLNNLMFLTSKQGRQALMSVMRSDQDRYLMGFQDPGCPDPQYRGIPIMRWDPLETAAVYDGASALQPEGTAAGTHFIGPRIYGLNGNFLHPIAHDEVMFQVDDQLRHPHIPDTWVQYESTWWQNVPKSFKHQGMVYPTANVYSGLY